MYNDVLEFEWPDDGLNPDDQANSAENNSTPLDVAPYMDQFNRTMTNTLRGLLSTVTSNPGIATEYVDSIVPEIPVENGKTIVATVNNTMSTEVSNGLSNFSTEIAETGTLFDTVTQTNILENATTVTDMLSTTDIVGNLTNSVSETLFSEIPNKTSTSSLDILTTESSLGETTTFKNVLNNVTQSIHDIISASTENYLNHSTDSNRTVIITDHNLNSNATTVGDSVENFTADVSQTIFSTTTEPTTYMSNDSNGTFLTNSIANMTTEATTLMANVTETIVKTVTSDTSTTTRMLSTTGNVHSTSMTITTTDISTVIDNFTHGILDTTEASILSKPNNSTFHSTNTPDVTTILTRITTATNKLGASHHYDTIETAQDIMMYIIIGVVLVFLIIVFIGLYLYYRKQRKGSLLIGTYYVTELHDTSSSNKSNNSITEKKEDSGV